MECIFCKIVAKDIKAEVVYEDEHSVAFLDLHPHAPGHVLVIPKTHVGTLSELSYESVGPYFLGVKQVLKQVEEGLKPDGVTIGINQGKAGGQEVAHLHTHLMPRFVGDGGGSLQSVVHNPPKENLTEIAKKLKIPQ